MHFKVNDGFRDNKDTVNQKYCLPFCGPAAPGLLPPLGLCSFLRQPMAYLFLSRFRLRGDLSVGHDDDRRFFSEWRAGYLPPPLLRKLLFFWHMTAPSSLHGSWPCREEAGVGQSSTWRLKKFKKVRHIFHGADLYWGDYSLEISSNCNRHKWRSPRWTNCGNENASTSNLLGVKRAGWNLEIVRCALCRLMKEYAVGYRYQSKVFLGRGFLLYYWFLFFRATVCVV